MPRLRDHRRIAVVGPGGAGKSTLAQELGTVLGLSVVHLDREYWLPGWRRRDEATWLGIQQRLVAKPEWIIDGNYAESLDLRLAAADAVIFVDFPPWRCVLRVLRRNAQFRTRARPDMAPGCRERFSLRFLWWLATFRRHTRQLVVDAIARADPPPVVYRLESPQRVRQLFAVLSGSTQPPPPERAARVRLIGR